MRKEEVGKKLRKMRKERKLSQEDLGKKIGVSQMEISRLERGVRFPSSRVLLGLKRLFKEMDLNEIFVA